MIFFWLKRFINALHVYIFGLLLELFEGDIVMDNSIRRAVLGLNEKRSAVEMSEEGHRMHWPDGVVPYTIDPSLSKLHFD